MKVLNHKLRQCGCINNRTWGFSITEVEKKNHFEFTCFIKERSALMNTLLM